ncbi:MAG: hypothetical protein AB7O86_12330 [Porticoccaceae bacterium]
MALQKLLLKLTGHGNLYWRIVNIMIDQRGAGSVVTLAGFKDRDQREIPGAIPDDQRRIELTQEETDLLGQFNAIQLLNAKGIDTSGWPAAIVAAVSQVSAFGLVATALYGAIKARPPIVITPEIPEHTDPETGEIIHAVPAVTEPSEFADAVDV